MNRALDAFTYQHGAMEITYGRGAAAALGDLLAARGLDRALVVCGSNVGANEALMAPIRRGLGDRLAGVFDGTTPAKDVAEAFAVADELRDRDADVLVGVGGGSSLDVARNASVAAASDRSLAELRETGSEGDAGSFDADPAVPVVVVPTTFAGADVSSGGGLEVVPAAESPDGHPVRIGGSCTPTATVHDPDLFETTPDGALAGSAMNGFNKGIETVYARDAGAITDATAVRGLRLFREGLLGLGTAAADAGEEAPLEEEAAMEAAVVGSILVQVDRRISVIHAFGHGFSRRYPVQQGDAHAVIAPEALRYVLSEVDGRRRVLAAGLGVAAAGRSDADLAARLVDAVAEVRDGLDVPNRIRDLDGVERSDLPAIAEYVVADVPEDRAPAGFDPTVAGIEDVLSAAW